MQLITQKYLSEEVFTDFFSYIYTQLKNYTCSINEYIYFLSFLYPEYLNPAVIAYQNSKVIETDNWEEVKKRIDKRGSLLVTKQYKSLVSQMLMNLYVHATSKDDILKEAE